jgi:hypothetical protein
MMGFHDTPSRATMCIGDALRELAAFLDECEDEGRVTGVGLVEKHGRGGSREVSAEVEVTLSVAGADGDGDLSLGGASVDEAGRLGLSFESLESVVPTPDGRVEVEPTGATFGSDATLTVTLTATVPADGGGGVAGEGATETEPTTDGGPEADDRDLPGVSDGKPEDSEPPAGSDRGGEVPPFRNPELLAEVYDSCDTFAEMTDAIGMDVTAETVRRYMIDYGIHQPNTYDTGGDDGDGDRDVEDDGAHAAETDENGSPVVLADGIGLPEDVTVETLIETVERSNTLYEVERDVGVDREDALEMLRELDLLDLVVGRLSTQDRRDISREDVVERLREASATGGG